MLIPWSELQAYLKEQMELTVNQLVTAETPEKVYRLQGVVTWLKGLSENLPQALEFRRKQLEEVQQAQGRTNHPGPR